MQVIVIGYTTIATATATVFGAGLNSCHAVFGSHCPYHSLKYLDFYLTSLWENSNRFSLLQRFGGLVIHCFDFFFFSIFIRRGNKVTKRYQSHWRRRRKKEENRQAGVVQRPSAWGLYIYNSVGGAYKLISHLQSFMQCAHEESSILNRLLSSHALVDLHQTITH